MNVSYTLEHFQTIIDYTLMKINENDTFYVIKNIQDRKKNRSDVKRTAVAICIQSDVFEWCYMNIISYIKDAFS